MTLTFIRRIDNSIGVLLCTFLGMLSLLKNFLIPSNKELEKKDVQTILCQKYFGMGSILLAIPLLKGLRENYPNAKIIFLTLEENKKVIELCSLADEVLVVRIDSLWVFTKDAIKNVAYLISKKIDVSIDLEFFAKFTMLVSFISMARIRVGFYLRNIRPKGMVTHKIPFNPYKHLMEIYFSFGTDLGIERKRMYFSSPLPTLKDLYGNILLEKFDLDVRDKFIIINVNSSHLFKFRCWPSYYFVELIQLLIDKYPEYCFIMIGSKNERNYVEGIYNKINHKNSKLINCAGQTSLEEFFALIEMSYLLITNDSGPMHIASLYGKNIVAFFGPETPIVYGPINKNSVVFYNKNMHCTPCLNVYDNKNIFCGRTCIQNDCLLEIKPKEVFKRIENVFLKN